MNLRRIGMLAIFLATPHLVQAEPRVYGQGAQLCQSFLAAAQDTGQDNSALLMGFLSWLSGYATYVSVETEQDVFFEMNAALMQAKLETACAAEPLSRFALVAHRVLFELPGMNQ